MSTKIFAPSYLYDYPIIASELEILKDADCIFLEESQKDDADHILYKDFHRDIEIHRNLFAYRAPQLIYFNNRFVFNTLIRNFHRRFQMKNIYDTTNMAKMVEPKTAYPMQRSDIDEILDDNSSYRLINTYEKYEDSDVVGASDLHSRFTDDMLALNNINRGKMSTKEENKTWLIEKIDTLNVPVKTIIGARDCHESGMLISKIYGADYEPNEYEFLLAFTNSVGNSNEKHPFTMSYHYDGENISIVNFRFEINEEIPYLLSIFK